MKVILLKDVKGTGKKGDVVKVNDGFGRNRLIPGGFAVEATKANIAQVERKQAAKEAQIAEERAEAKKMAELLSEKPVVLETMVGEGGRLFGSITSMDIAEAIKAQTGHDIDKKKIVLDKPIKSVGTFTVTVKLYTEIAAEIEVQIKEA